MDKARHRRIEARDRRQESLRNRVTVPETPKASFPIPTNLRKEPIAKVVENKTESVAVKRGRGRPPKLVTDKASKVEKHLQKGNVPAVKGKGRK